MSYKVRPQTTQIKRFALEKVAPRMARVVMRNQEISFSCHGYYYFAGGNAGAFIFVDPYDKSGGEHGARTTVAS